MQLEMTFNALNGDCEILEREERRVVVTPDESPIRGKNDILIGSKVIGENGYLGVCKMCKKGDVYLLKFADCTTDVRCTFCAGRYR